MEQAGKGGEQIAMFNITQQSIKFDKDASHVDISGKGPIIWILKKFSKTITNDIFEALNSAGLEFLDDTMETEINNAVKNNQYLKVLSNIELDTSLTVKPYESFPRTTFEFNGSFIAETADGKKVRADPSTLASPAISSEDLVKFTEDADVSFGISAATVNSFFAVVQQNNIKLDFVDLAPLLDDIVFGSSHPHDILIIDDLCPYLPNICDKGYSLDPKTQIRAYLSLPNATKPSTFSIADDSFAFDISSMRIELFDYKTNELYQDFILEDVTWNMTAYTKNGRIQDNDGQSSVHIGNVKFATRTAYMHLENDVWKMSKVLLDITGKIGELADGNRFKSFMGVYLYKFSLKLDAASQALYLGGFIDPTYFGLPQ